MMGPFLDLTAGTTEEALTIDATEVWLSKNGGAYANKNEATEMVHDTSGMYLLKLDSTDTNTVGTLSVIVDDTANAAIPVSGEYQVVETAVYDALYANAATAFSSSGEVSLLAATQASIDAIEEDTGTTLDALIDSIVTAVITNATGADVATDVVAIKTAIDAITAEVVTAQTLPAQGAPSASPPIADAIMWLYKAWRNKSTQTATEYKLYNDAGDTVDTKASLSSDGTIFTSNEKATGP